MARVVLLTLFAIFSTQILTTIAQGNTSNQFNLNTAYCFRLSWLGPTFDGSTDITGITCEDLKIDAADGVPCSLPLVISNNANLPNMTALWDRFRDSDVSHVACRLTRGDVCVKYTYSYNQQVENVTYMCAKVTIADEGPTTSGCFSEFRSGREIQVCACQSRPGEVPCNASIPGRIIGSLLIMLTVLSWIFLKVC